MENQNVLNGNKLIAEFMGFLKPYGDVYQCCFNNINITTNGEYIRFHKSWDWLMPVVEKIENLKSPVYIHSNCCTIYEKVNFNTDKGDLFIESYNDNKLLAVYDTVIKYIKWYNNKNMKKQT